MVCAFCESWAVAFYPGCTPKKFSFLFVTWARVRFVLFLLIASDRELGWNLATRPVTTLTFLHVHICRHDHWRSYLPDDLWDVVHHHGNSFHGCSSLLELVVQELVVQDLQCSSNMLWDEGGPTCACVCVCVCVRKQGMCTSWPLLVEWRGVNQESLVSSIIYFACTCTLCALKKFFFCSSVLHRWCSS